MRILFLDDSLSRCELFLLQLSLNPRAAEYKVFTTHSALEAIGLLNTEPRFDLAMLDHDLGSFDTGLDVAKHISRMSIEKRPRAVRIHSFNPSGAARMLLELQVHNVAVEHVPFSIDTIKLP